MEIRCMASFSSRSIPASPSSFYIDWSITEGHFLIQNSNVIRESDWIRVSMPQIHPIQNLGSTKSWAMTKCEYLSSIPRNEVCHLLRDRRWSFSIKALYGELWHRNDLDQIWHSRPKKEMAGESHGRLEILQMALERPWIDSEHSFFKGSSTRKMKKLKRNLCYFTGVKEIVQTSGGTCLIWTNLSYIIRVIKSLNITRYSTGGLWALLVEPRTMVQAASHCQARTLSCLILLA